MSHMVNALKRDPACGSHFPDDSALKSILAERIDMWRQGVGIVIGIIEGTQRRVISHGCFGRDDPRAPDGDTLFEIGSVTKGYTGLLLADMVRRGETALDEPVQNLLPARVSVPVRNGRTITLHDLATHRSGLPPMPDNFVGGETADAYANYSVDDLYRFLSTHQMIHRIGAKFRYSNLGIGLLGHALSCRARCDYESLIRERILRPLGLHDTAIVLSDALKDRLAPGHDLTLKPTPNWNYGPPFSGAGALRSTVHDQLTFIEAMLGSRPSSLEAAISDTVTIRRSRGERAREVGLGWGVDTLEDDEMVVHSGETAGYSAVVACLRWAEVGVVVLANARCKIADIGLHLINPSMPLSRSPMLPV
ncbi:MAG: serine-type D-Ala-D-Ala carboxypeptidase/endopeptidase [Caballeronia sp.]|nr:serine-type D-Ala-D-Ala carboxypeptidase/endopeptidase [Caballeronia sp.]